MMQKLEALHLESLCEEVSRKNTYVYCVRIQKICLAEGQNESVKVIVANILCLG